MSEAGAYGALLREFFPVWLRFHPEVALGVGEPAYVRLPAVGDDEAGALVSWMENLVVALEELDFASLDEDQRLEVQLVFGGCHLELEELIESDWRHRDPFRFLPFRILHRLKLILPADYPETMLRLLSALPQYLRHARAQLSTFPGLVSRVSLAAALEEAEAGAGFVGALVSDTRLLRTSRDKGRLREICGQAATATRDFVDYMQQELAPLAAGGLGCGEPHYRRIWQHRHFLDLDPEWLREQLHRQIDEQTSAVCAIGQALTGQADLSRLARDLAEVEPSSGEQRLEVARAECARIRLLGEERALVTLPQSTLGCAEKTTCLRPGLAEITYVAPSVLGASLSGGQLLLPPLPEGATEGRPEVFRRCVEGGWLGEHLLVAAARRGSRGLVRRVYRSATLFSGWKTYLLRVLEQTGCVAAPEEIAVLRLARLRALRLALVDLEIHTRGMSYADAVAWLQQTPGWDREKIDFALAMVSMHPTDAAAGAVGASLIESARSHLEAREPAFSLRQFHDRLLSQGAVALPLVICRAFGEEFWSEVRSLALG